MEKQKIKEAEETLKTLKIYEAKTVLLSKLIKAEAKSTKYKAKTTLLTKEYVDKYALFKQNEQIVFKLYYEPGDNRLMGLSKKGFKLHHSEFGGFGIIENRYYHIQKGFIYKIRIRPTKQEFIHSKQYLNPLIICNESDLIHIKKYYRKKDENK